MQIVKEYIMDAFLDSLEVHIQPFYNIKHQKIVGAEALVRSKDNKELKAMNILDTLKTQGKLVDFDIFMMEKICQSIAFLNKRHLYANENVTDGSAIAGKPLNVNISPETLNENGAGQRILSIIQHYNVSDSIVVELNEGSLFESKAVEENIHTFVDGGVTLSLDDFNMTNKGLMALSKYNVREVKFKQTGLGEFTHKDIIILKYLNEMCGELKLNIVVEGIETITQFEALKRIGIETIQGYIVSKPIPFKQYTTSTVNLIRV